MCDIVCDIARVCSESIFFDLSIVVYISACLSVITPEQNNKINVDLSA